MATGNLKASKWAIVINAKKETPSADIKPTLEVLLTELLNYITCKNYFAIIHDKDTDELGQPKRTHLHLILEYTQKTTKTAVLNELTQVVGLDTEQVSLDPANSPILAEQYLIHKNDPSKYQYDISQIRTNNLEELNDRISERYLTEEEKQQERELALNTATTFSELIDRAGIDFANKYRGLFKDLRTERNQDYESLLLELGKVQREFDSLKQSLIYYYENLIMFPEDYPLDKVKKDLERIITLNKISRD